MKWVYEHRKLFAVILIAIVVAIAAPHLTNMKAEDIINYSTEWQAHGLP